MAMLLLVEPKVTLVRVRFLGWFSARSGRGGATLPKSTQQELFGRQVRVQRN